MKLKKGMTVSGYLFLISSIIITGLAACIESSAAPYDGQTTSGQGLVSTGSPAPSSAIIPPTPILYPEPSSPPGFSSIWKWNPYKNEWYDSRTDTWNPITQSYDTVIPPLPPEYLSGKYATQTIEEWLEEHRDSTDEIDIALLKFYPALLQWDEKQRREDPDYQMHPAFDYGPSVGGPLEILTSLGIPKLQKLIDKVQWENPCVKELEIAIDRTCRASIIPISQWDFEVADWKKDLNDKVANSRLKVSVIIQDIASGKADEKTAHEKFSSLGIFALPEAYELIINKGNTSLINYLPDILPLDKMKEYNIQAGQTDDETLKNALASCKDYIEIIKTLHAD